MTQLDAIRLAGKLMFEHGLHQWELKISRGYRILGYCDYTNRTIALSRHYIENNSIELVTDTILHEIAHALVGYGHGHDAVWRMKCREIGANPSRICHDAVMPKGNFKAVCNGCGREFFKYRLREAARNGNRYCAKCGPDIGRLIFQKNK